MIKPDYGVYCEVYGENIDNYILEYVLENQDLDFAASDIVEDTGVSKPKVYEVIEKLLKKGVLKKTRVIAGAQLYSIDKSNRIAQLFMRDFMECLKMAADNRYHIKGSGVAMVCEKKT